MDTSDNMYSVVIRAIASRFAGDTGPAETVDTTSGRHRHRRGRGRGGSHFLAAARGWDIVITASADRPGRFEGASVPVEDTDTVINTETWKWEVSKVAPNVLRH